MNREITVLNLLLTESGQAKFDSAIVAFGLSLSDFLRRSGGA